MAVPKEARPRYMPGELERDLSRLRLGRLQYVAFKRRHSGWLAMLAGPWIRVLCARFGFCREDMQQEFESALWEATVEWDPLRGVPMTNFVRLKVNRHMRTVFRKTSADRHRELRYFGMQVIEERVVSMRTPDQMQWEYVAPQHEQESVYDGMVKLEEALDNLPPRNACIVRAFFEGEDVEVIASRLFAGSDEYRRRAVTQSFAQARRIVEGSLTPLQETLYGTPEEYHQDRPTSRLRPLRKARQPDVGQRDTRSVAG